MKNVIRIVAVLLLVSMLAIPASANSVTQTGKPTVTVQQPAGKTELIEQKEAPAVAIEGTTKEVTVTAVADLEKAAPEVKAAVEKAYKSIESAGSLKKAAPALVQTLKEVAPTAKIENMVVRDLIHVDVKLEKDEKVTLKFDLKVEKDAIIIPMQFIDGKWVPVDPKLVTINADGSVSVEFTGEVGTLAFVTEKSE